MTSGLSALEHELLPVGDLPGQDRLSTAEAELLSAYSEIRRGFCARGHQSVRLANYAGLLNLGGRMLEVLPKIESVQESKEACRGVLMRLLRMAEKLPIETFEGADHELRHGTLLDVFISAYFAEVAKLLRGGLLRRYQSWEEDLPMIRGRLLLDRQIRTHGMRPDRLACRFDEFTADNDWNRVLKTALGCVKRQISSLPLRRRWAELWPAFDEVAVLPEAGHVFGKLSPDRQVARYARAVCWARWIVSALTPNIRIGTRQAPGLLFDTNRLFEQAVAKRLGSALSGREDSLWLRTQVGGKFLARVRDIGIIGLRPDLIVMDGDHPIVIGDTKWKCIGSRNGYLEPSPEDVYQMLAYVAAFRCPDVALIYPWHEGVARANETILELPEIEGLRPKVHIVCVDVRRDGLPVVVGSDSKLGKLLTQ